MKSNRIVPGLLTTIVVIAVLLLVGRSQKPDRHPERPETVVWSMIDASRAGDVKAYLNSFTGDLERTLQKTIESMTEPRFVDYLKRTNGEIKGIVISDPNQTGAQEVKLGVEFIYANKNELQNYKLKKIGSRWKIVQIDGPERVKTLIPYGTEVFPSAKEDKR